jgi:hypothetical protein
MMGTCQDLEEDKPSCMDCAFPKLKEASEHAAKAVENRWFKETGEHRNCGELLRHAMWGEPLPPYDSSKLEILKLVK